MIGAQPHDPYRFDQYCAGVLACLLLAAPKANLSLAGVPLYAVDGLIAVILVRVLSRPPRHLNVMRPIPGLAAAFLTLILLSELRGAVTYSLPFGWLYMALRFTLAVSLAYTLPRILVSPGSARTVIAGLAVGMVLASATVILYSLPATRGLTLRTIFAWRALCPESRTLIAKTTDFYGADAVIRGRSLIGAATFTSGVLASLWPLALLLQDMHAPVRRGWGVVMRLAVTMAPVAILATYGRTAWLSVTLVLLVLVSDVRNGLIRGLSLAAVAFVVILHIVPTRYDWRMVERVVVRTEQTFVAPTKDVSDRERFFSYVEPFVHLVEHPSWLLVGAGRTGQRLVRRADLRTPLLFDEGSRATHSAFSIAYYAFGLPAALCHILLMSFAFRYILSSRRQARGTPDYATWNVLLAAWCGLLPWWLFGHGCVGEPRGAMVFFLMYGLLLAYGQIAAPDHARAAAREQAI